MKKKAHCKHLRIPDYDPNETKTVAWLNEEIEKGEPRGYFLLTRLAVKVVEEGRFHRETCSECV